VRHGSEEDKGMNSRRKQYPVKSSVNLLCKEKTNSSLVRTLLAVAVFLFVLVVFFKFAVIDRLVRAEKAMQKAEDIENDVAGLKLANSDYEDVLREYQHYYFSAADMAEENEEDAGNGTAPQVYVNSLKVLELVDEELLHKSGIQMINLTGNVLTVNLTKINLERASVIAKSLSDNEMVQEVIVSAANRQEETAETAVYLNIILAPEKSDAAGQNTDAEQNIDAEEDE